jgi:DNA-binding transcriptional LysR family regulator
MASFAPSSPPFSSSASFDLRVLRQFVVLAEELHFGRAAERLHMTQPPLSAAIRRLEEAWGLTLFHRTQRTVRLSAQAEGLLPLARALLRDAEALSEAAQAAQSGRRGRLRLGFVSTIGYGPLPHWLDAFRRAWPGVELHLREATFDVQMAAFEAQELDLGFVLHAPGEAPAGFEAMVVARDRLALAMPDTHPLSQGALVLAQALALPLMLFPRRVAPSLFDHLMAFYRAHGVQARLSQEATQTHTLINLVSVGMGLTWVPEPVVQLQRPGVVFRRLGEQAPWCETSLIWRPDAGATVGRFVDEVRRAMQPAEASAPQGQPTAPP